MLLVRALVRWHGQCHFACGVMICQKWRTSFNSWYLCQSSSAWSLNCSIAARDSLEVAIQKKWDLPRGGVCQSWKERILSLLASTCNFRERCNSLIYMNSSSDLHHFGSMDPILHRWRSPCLFRAHGSEP